MNKNREKNLRFKIYGSNCQRSEKGSLSYKQLARTGFLSAEQAHFYSVNQIQFGNIEHRNVTDSNRHIGTFRIKEFHQKVAPITPPPPPLH